MLEYAIFAVTFVLALLIAVIYLYPGSSKPTSIPGLEPTTKEDGNLTDISRAGSLHEFLIDLHKKFGNIVSFWMGQTFVVSIASPELFKEHQGVFDRPPLKDLKKQIIEVIKERKKNRPKTGEEILIDIILEKTEDEEIQLSDSIAFVVGGFHTTANLLTWAFYFLASHQDVQQKLYEEIQSVLGKEDVDHTNIGELVYLRQVQDETLRCAVVAPWAARFQDFDSELGGHKIPKNVSLFWGLFFVFDPDRFSPENTKKRPALAFSPFGFAGKRICPGYRFSYAEASVCMVTLLKKFKVHMVEGQVVIPVHGLVTHPADEIWITISKR
ncbi:hypothetical protein ACJMK2_023498 [Sinanodonta woodiana]|uniref:Cytochrome P450 n=1 Tax=Sinanodonta woodiana TaxID=1069815 RepID=A0ABD3T4E8_SINWO